MKSIANNYNRYIVSLTSSSVVCSIDRIADEYQHVLETCPGKFFLFATDSDPIVAFSRFLVVKRSPTVGKELSESLFKALQGNTGRKRNI